MKVTKHDAEEINLQQPEESAKEGMTLEESKLLDELREIRQIAAEQQQQIRRLEAIADKNKGAAFDHENRDKSFKGHLRHIGDPKDPIVFWKTIKNVSTIDPQTNQLIQDQRFLVKTLKGKEREMDIHEWNLERAYLVHIKFLKMDHQNNICDVQLSDDGGNSFVGEVIKDLPMTFVNP